ncbi:MAG: aldo/keto reductase [Chloroflexi bacterium]|nr:aldo/keto reductase [Chloroflexota bacterium]
MEYRRLGRSGLKVSRVCLGTNMLGGYVDEAASLRVVDTALEQGINFIDTSNSYTGGRSEEVLGKAMKGRRQQVILATKVVSPVGPGVNDRGASRKHMMDAVEASLRRLQTDYIDVYYQHFWDADTPLEETLRTFDDLVRQGKVRYAACSNFYGWQLMKALWISEAHNLVRFEAVQPEYSFLRRGVERELFPACLDQEVGVVPYRVLMVGIFAGRYQVGQEPPPDSRLASLPANRERFMTEDTLAAAEGLKEMAARGGHTPAELCIAWALSNPVITSVILGSSRPEQVIANAKSVDIKLTPDELEACNRLGKLA